jgi:hypothetical protein
MIKLFPHLSTLSAFIQKKLSTLSARDFVHHGIGEYLSVCYSFNLLFPEHALKLGN